jgi:hypothetical protein
LQYAIKTDDLQPYTEKLPEAKMGPEAPEPSFVDIFASARDEVYASGQWFSQSYNARDVYQRQIDRAKEATGVELNNPRSVYLGYGGSLSPDEEPRFREGFNQYQKDGGVLTERAYIPVFKQKDFTRQMDELREKHPDKAGMLMPEGDFEAQAYGYRAEKRRAQEQMWERSDKGIAASTASLTGQLYGGLMDPFNVVAGVFSPNILAARGVYGLASAAAKTGAVNAATQAVVEPLIQADNAKAGLPAGMSEAAQSIVGAFVLGAGLDLPIRAGFRGAQSWRGLNPVENNGVIVGWEKPGASASATRETPPAVEIPPDLVARANLDTPSGRKAMAEIEAIMDGSGRLSEATVQRAEAGDPAAVRKVAEATGEIDKPAVRGLVDTLDAEAATIRVKPDDVDPETHSQALQSTLAHVSNPSLSPAPAAIRSAAPANGWLDALEARIEGVERAAYTPEQMEAAEMLRMMREGSPVEVAAILRNQPAAMTQDLDFSSTRMVQARALASLEPEMFARVEDGYVSPPIAALVADYVAPEMHARAMDDMMEANPKTLADARALVAELLASPDYKGARAPDVMDRIAKKQIDDPYGKEAQAQSDMLERQLAEQFGTKAAPDPTPDQMMREALQRADAIQKALDEAVGKLPPDVTVRTFTSIDSLPPELAMGARAAQTAQVQQTILAFQMARSTQERLQARMQLDELMADPEVGFKGSIYQDGAIWLSTFSVNPAGRLGHEGVHHLVRTGRLTAAEVVELAGYARENALFGPKRQAEYEAAYQGRSNLGEALDEEGASHLLEAVINGQHVIPDAPQTASVRGIIGRIVEIMTAIRNALIGRKAIEPAMDPNAAVRAIVDAILSGEVAKREATRALMRAEDITAMAVRTNPMEGADDVIPDYRNPDTGEPLNQDQVMAILGQWRALQDRKTKAPQSLVPYLMELGRLQDQGGEITNMLGGAARYLINNANGQALDDAALRAWEAGYIPTADRPSIPDFLEYVSRELGGEKVFRSQDADAVASRASIETVRQELDRMGLSDAKSEREVLDRLAKPRSAADMMFALGDLAGRNNAKLIDDVGRDEPHPGRVLALHGTRVDFDTFDPKKSRDFGVHFGTTGQSDIFAGLISTRDEARVFPVVIDAKTVVDVPDLMTWSPTEVASAVAAKMPDAQGLEAEVRAAIQSGPTYFDEKFERTRPTQEAIDQGKEVLRAGLSKRGIEALRYWNEAEGDGWSYIVWEKGPVTSATSGNMMFAFAGERATNADLEALALAKKMTAEGVDRTKVWSDTGWFKGVDGKWRWEIDDKGAFVKGGDRSASASAAMWGPGFVGDFSKGVMAHRDMLAAYPEMADIRFQGRRGSGGNYQRSMLSDGVVTVGDDYRGKDKNSVALHEAQHAAQDIEGFARGGSAAEFSTDDLKRQAFEKQSREIQDLMQSDPASAEIYRQMNRLKIRTKEKGWTEPDFDELTRLETELYNSPIGRQLDELSWQREDLQGRPDDYWRGVAVDRYRTMAGEVEARAVEKRMDLTAEERRARPPWLDYDVPEDQQIVRFGSGQQNSEPMFALEDTNTGRSMRRDLDALGPDWMPPWHQPRDVAEIDALAKAVDPSGQYIDRATAWAIRNHIRGSFREFRELLSHLRDPASVETEPDYYIVRTAGGSSGYRTREKADAFAAEINSNAQRQREALIHAGNRLLTFAKQKNPNYTLQSVARWVYHPAYDALKVGDIFTDPSFMSTTKASPPRDVDSIDHSALLRIRQWSGFDIEASAFIADTSLNVGEQEVLLPPGRSFKVVATKTNKNGFAIIDLEETIPANNSTMMFALSDGVGRLERRDLDALGYYSGALEAAKGLKQAKGTPEQMLAQLKAGGAKQNEIEATNLAAFLDGKKSVTRDEIVRYLEDNRVGLNEVVRGKEGRFDRDGFAVKMFGVPYIRLSRDDRAVVDAAEPKPVKFPSNSLDPSNPTYRETVLHLPDKRGNLSELNARRAELDAMSDWTPAQGAEHARLQRLETDNTNFRFGHFPEPNIVGHFQSELVRLGKEDTKRLAPNWSKPEQPVVFVPTQIQSDWGQKLRDGGVRDEAKIAELKRRAADAEQDYIATPSGANWFARVQQISDAASLPKPSTYKEAYSNLTAILNRRDYMQETARAIHRATADDPAAADFRRLYAEAATAESAASGNPLVNTTDQWTNTTLRRALRQAAEADADYIAIPSGDTVLSYNPGDEGGMRGFYGKLRATDERLADLRDRLVEQEAEVIATSGLRQETAMKRVDAIKEQIAVAESTVDGIIPKNLRKLLEKIDKDAAKPIGIDQLETPTSGLKGEGFTLFPLTDKVKASVLDDGQPMFALQSPGDQRKQLKIGAAQRAKDLEAELAQIETAFQASGGDQRTKLHAKRAALQTALAVETRLDEQLGYRNLYNSADPARAFLLQHQAFGSVSDVPFGDVFTARKDIENQALTMMGELAWKFRKGAILGDRKRNTPFMKTAMENVVREMAGESSNDQTAKTMAQGVLKTFEWLRQRRNAAGGDVAKLAGWFAPQHHDAEALMAIGPSKWIERLMNDGVLDRDRMVNFATGERMDDETLRGMLSDMYRTIVSGGMDKIDPATASMGKAAMYKKGMDHRVLHFKDADSWIAYQRELGGGDLFAAFIGHIQKEARDIAAMEAFGANPNIGRERIKANLKQLAANVRVMSTVADDMKATFAGVLKQAKAELQPAQYQPLEAAVNGGTKRMLAIVDEIGKLKGQGDPSPLKLELAAIQTDLATRLNDPNTAIANPQLTKRAIAVLDDIRFQVEIGKLAFGPVGDIQSYVNGLIYRADNVWAAYTGESATPVNLKAAQLMAAKRNYVSAATLIAAPISAINDQAMGLQARWYNGMPITTQIMSFIKGFTPADKELAMHLGFGLEAALSAMNERASAVNQLNTQYWSGYIADRSHTFSGLSPMTSASKVGFALDWSRFMGTLLGKDWNGLPEFTRRMMQKHGITPADWQQLSRVEATMMDGRRYLSREDVVRDAGDDLAAKYMTMFYREASFATLEGTTRSRTIVVGKTQPGTIEGELLRTAAMLKSFPTTYVMQIMARQYGDFMRGRLDQAAVSFVAITIVGTLLGATAVQLKNLNSGRDPEDMTGMKNGKPDPSFWIKAWLQGGGAGILGDFIGSATSRTGGGIAGAALGPVPQLAGNVAHLAASPFGVYFGRDEKTNPGREAVDLARRLTPGAFVPFYVRTIYERMVLDELQRIVDPEAAKAFRAKHKAQEKLRGSPFYYGPGDRTARTPNLNRMLGAN